MVSDESNNNTAVPVANVEQNSSHAPLAEKETKGFNTLVNIKVISYRKLKHDPDGVSVKAVLDGIVRNGILVDDSTEQVKQITLQSIICKKGEAEKTVIEITNDI